MDPVQNQTPIVNAPYYYPDALTTESMMVYLTTRLGSIDGQIQGFFTAQTQSEKLRAAINDIKKLLNDLDQSSKKEKSLEGGAETLAQIESIIEDQIAPVDAVFAERLESDLKANGHILHLAEEGDEGDENLVYTTLELEKTKEYLNSAASQLESTAQMNMIQLQSLMSARQTAISLATNLLAKLDESIKNVVDNLR